VQCLFDTSRPPPLFGAKYDFNLEGVVNCPEFLVYFPLLERIAGEFGLKRILKENFRSFYLRKIKEHAGLNLLRKMNALEVSPLNYFKVFHQYKYFIGTFLGVGQETRV
jgi:mRNA capping enzyme.